MDQSHSILSVFRKYKVVFQLFHLIFSAKMRGKTCSYNQEFLLWIFFEKLALFGFNFFSFILVLKIRRNSCTTYYIAYIYKVTTKGCPSLPILFTNFFEHCSKRGGGQIHVKQNSDFVKAFWHKIGINRLMIVTMNSLRVGLFRIKGIFDIFWSRCFLLSNLRAARSAS